MQLLPPLMWVWFELNAVILMALGITAWLRRNEPVPPSDD